VNFLLSLIAWLNIAADAAGDSILGPVIARLPGWLGNTIISAVAGVLLLVIFKYTSNQAAISRIRDDIKANMLALKLFKDDIVVTLRAQGRVFRGAFALLFYAIVPMLVMIMPVSLLLGQVGLWYQHRPLKPGEKATITMQLKSDDVDTSWPQVAVVPTEAIEVATGPVRVLAQRQICWEVEARQVGYHRLLFDVENQRVTKDLAIGDGLMPVSVQRPGRGLSAMMLNPHEEPFADESVVQSISIIYPDRPGWASGTNRWVIYFFVVSMVFALIFKPLFKVRI